MKKIIFTILILVYLMPATYAQTFSDVPQTSPSYAAIEFLQSRDIVGGYPDGTFKPNSNVNRVEALKMILQSAEIISPDNFKGIGLSDVPNDSWFAKYVAKAKAEGIIKGNPDGTFAPARSVNKAEFIKMLLQAFEIDLSSHQNLTEGISTDTDATDWFLPYLSYATTIGIINPNLANQLRPEKTLTRKECAEMIYKLILVIEGGDVQKMLSITESKLVYLLVALSNDDIETAKNYANDAVFYSEQALNISPGEGLVKAANKIALGFRSLTLGYQAGLVGDYEGLKFHVEAAKKFAGQAYDDDNSTQPLGKKIKEQANLLLSQTGE